MVNGANVHPRPRAKTGRSFRRVATLAIIALFAGGTFTPNLIDELPAGAASSTLCTGYDTCEKAGYTHHGYKAKSENKSRYWLMYAGHNCTNYVAYMLVTYDGASKSRPWTGSGNASNWGKALASKTDRTVTVGSVAWWKYGHVAYVEEARADGSIVISEDSWGGEFHWRVVKPGSSWPDGFIHLTEKSRVKTGASSTGTTTPVEQDTTDGLAEEAETGTATNSTATKTTTKVPSKTKATLSKKSAKRGKTVKVTVKVTVSGAKNATGTVTIRDGSKKLKTVKLKAKHKGKVTVTLPKLKRGTHKISAKFAGGSVTPTSTKVKKLASGAKTITTKASTSSKAKLKIR